MDFTNEKHILALRMSVSESLGSPVHIGVPEGAKSWDDCVFVDGDNEKPSWDAISSDVEAVIAADSLEELRAERDRLIAETDWWAMSDRIMTAEQTAYRQALRDITETYSSLEEAVFPEKPE